MNLGKYCKSKGFTKEEYKQFKLNIQAAAEAIKSQLVYCNGMYFPTAEIVNEGELKPFIIAELKKLNVEFFSNNELYRVID